MISHEEALDLATDSLDFDLFPQERTDLDAHLASCRSCSRYADMLREDDDVLENAFDWRDVAPQNGQDDEYGMRFEDDDEDEAITVASSDEPLERGRGGDDSEGSEDLMLGDSPEGGDEAQDEESRPARPERDRPDAVEREPDDDEDLASRGDGAESDEDEADDDGERRASSTAGGAPEGEDDDEDDEDDEDDDEDDEFAPDVLSAEEAALRDSEDRAAAAQAAAVMSDEDLGGVDPDASPEDSIFESCAADMVEETAGENGAPVGAAVQERAERALRAEEAMTDTGYGKVAVYRSTKGFRRDRDSRYNMQPEASSTAAAAIRAAILRSRTGRTGMERHQARGRLDSKGIHRIAERDLRLFKRAIVPDPGKYLVWVMPDVSGSMQGYPVAQAASVARALADASHGLPTVRMAVWAWSSPFLDEAHYGAVAGVAKIWETGAPTSTIFELTKLKMGGTPDAAVLSWAWRQILKETRPDERPVIIMASDGFGDRGLPFVIEEARKHGVDVKSVSLGRGLVEADQLARFGRGNYVPWQGSINATARPLAIMVAKMATGG